MSTRTLLLQDLIGASIQDIRTVRDLETGEETVYFYLTNNIIFGAEIDDLYAVLDEDFEDVWVDFDDFLEDPATKDPTPDDTWREQPDEYLLLADLKDLPVRSVMTAEDDGEGWIYIALGKDITVKVPEDGLLADGDYEDVWTDFERFLTTPAKS